MPYVLTEQEKEALRQQYRTNIETINSYIPDQHAQYRYKLDMNGLNKQLNDPAKAWIYKKSLEANAIEAKKKEIQERLGQKFDHMKIPGKVYGLNRFFHTELIPSDDPEAVAYNEAKYLQYMQHPEAVAQRRFNRILKANVSQLAKIAQCKNKEALMTAWAARNPNALQDAYELLGTIGKFPQNMLTPAQQQYLNSVSRNYEVMMDTADQMIHVTENSLVLPRTMNEQQDMILMGSDIDTDHPELWRGITENLTAAKTEADRKAGFDKFFKAVKNANISTKNDGDLTSYVVVNEGGKDPYVSLGAWANGQCDGTPRIQKLDDNTVAEIQQVFTQDFMHEEGYQEPEFPAKFREPAWKAARDDLIFQYAVEFDLPIQELDNGGFSKIAEHIKGGIGERMFKTTSVAFKNLKTAMAEYDKENHVNYHKPGPVKTAANQYLIHKGITTREQAMALSSPAKERSLLCFDIIETFQKHEPENEAKIVPGVVPPAPKKAEAPVIEEKKPWPPAIEDPKILDDDNVEAEVEEQKEPAAEAVKENDKKDIEIPE